MALDIDVKWREQYVSAGLNRKFNGVIPPGVYRGFDVTAPNAGMFVNVGALGRSSAVIEDAEFSLTVSLDGVMAVPVMVGTNYLVIEANYAVQTTTAAEFKLVSEPLGNQIILATLTIPGGTVDVLAGHISYAERQEHDLAALAKLIRKVRTAVEVYQPWDDDDDTQLADAHVSGIAAHAAGNNHPAATTAAKGMVVLATVPQAVAGVLNNVVVTPEGLAAAVTALVNSAPATIDTLGEIATALGNDPNLATTLINLIGLKAPLVSPAFTGTPTVPTPVAGTSSAQSASTAFVVAEIASSPRLLRAFGRGTNVDWNTAIPTNDRFGGAWWFDGGGVNPNGPEGANSTGALYQFNALWISGAPNGALQLANNGGNDLWYRTHHDSVWNPWVNLNAVASETKAGRVELATNAEAQAGTDATRAVTPAALASALGNVGRGWTASQLFTASGTFTVPANINTIFVEVVGGGGAGGGTDNVAPGSGGGGGGGGYSCKKIAVAPGQSIAVTVGNGGTGSTGTGTNGSTSSFGAHCSATGGAGGRADWDGAGVGGAGGGAAGGDLNLGGGGGDTSDNTSYIPGGGGSAPRFGGGGVGQAGTGGGGGVYGGGGGGGGGVNGVGGAGAPGCVLVWY